VQLKQRVVFFLEKLDSLGEKCHRPTDVSAHNTGIVCRGTPSKDHHCLRKMENVKMNLPRTDALLLLIHW
jgi:hypothetical protein